MHVVIDDLVLRFIFIYLNKSNLNKDKEIQGKQLLIFTTCFVCFKFKVTGT